MKENEREETSLTTEQDAAKQKRRQQEERSRLFQMIAGGYLVYLAWQLISGAIAENGWTTMKIVGIVAGALFAIVGIGLLIHNLRAEAKKYKAAQQPENLETKEGEDET